MATQLVNKHITRVLAAGGTVAEPAWLDTVEAWITSEGLLPYLFDWTNPAFGVVKNGSNEISKLMGLGTTWLPRLGDLTPVSPTDTTYDATAINGFPGWVNGVNTAISYYGDARAGTIRTNNIRRKHHQGFTIVAVYKKTGTAVASFFGYGQNGGIYLQNTSGASGQCKANFGRPAGGSNASATHATTLTNGSVNIIGCTFNQASGLITPYVEGVAGTTATISYGANPAEYLPLLGMNESYQGYSNIYSGSSTARVSLSGTTPSLIGIANEALFSSSDLIAFDTDQVDMASLNTLLRTRYGP